MSDDVKGRGFTRLSSQGHRIERRLPPQLESLGQQDRAVRSVPPGGPLPKRYSRNVIGELFDERYGDKHTPGATKVRDVPEPKRVVVARKAAAEGNDGASGGPSAVPLTDDPAPKKKRGFFGFGRR